MRPAASTSPAVRSVRATATFAGMAKPDMKEIQSNCVEIQKHLREIPIDQVDPATLGIVIEAIGSLCDQVARLAEPRGFLAKYDQ